MYSEHISEFHGRPVVDFNKKSDWQGAETAYRLREDYEDELKVSDRLAALLAQPGSDKLSSLIIGAWTGSCEGDDSAEIVAELAKAAPRLPGLRHLFFGEMVVDECEISWINQSDV